MSYINHSQQIRQQVHTMQKLNETFVGCNGLLKLRLADGRTVQGRYYGAHCSTNATAKLCCKVTLGDEDGDFPGVYDLLDIIDVEAVNGN